MTVVVNDIVRMACVWKRAAADDITNVWYFVLSAGSADDAMMPDVARQLMESLYADTDVVDNMSNQLTHDRIELYHVSDDRPLPDSGGHTPLDGNGSSDPTAAGVAALLVLQTAVKRRVGRKFLPIFTEDSYDGDELITGALARVDAMGSVTAADMTLVSPATTWRVVVGSGLASGFSTVVTGVPKAIAAYQRRRRPGRGS